MRKWKLEFMASLGYSHMPARRVAASLSRVGYQAVGWTLAHFNPRSHSKEHLAEVVRASHDYGLDIGEIVVQQDYVSLDEQVRSDRIRLSLECIAAAADHGLTVLNFFTGPAPWDPSAPVIGRDIEEDAARDMVLRAYEQIVCAAERNRVHIAVEGVWGMLCRDYHTTLPLIEHFSSPWLGVNFDPSHDILSGNLDIAAIIKRWGSERIFHIHLKDAVGVPQMGKFLFPMLGEGLVPWDGFFTALVEIGYAGCCSVEFESFAYHNQVLKGDTEQAARLSYDQVKALLPSNQVK